MGQKRRRYVGRAVVGVGWRVWDNKRKRFWGQVYDPLPLALLEELNGEKRPQSLTLLANLLRLKNVR